MKKKYNFYLEINLMNKLQSEFPDKSPTEIFKNLAAEHFDHRLRCEWCNRKMSENEYSDNLPNNTAGIIKSGYLICFECAKKYEQKKWTRLGAETKETYKLLNLED